MLNGLPVVTMQEQEKEEQLEEEEWEEEEEVDKLVTALQLAVVSSYIWRLKRRQHWKMSTIHLIFIICKTWV